MDKEQLFYEKNRKNLEKNVNKYRSELSQVGNAEEDNDLAENLNTVLENIVDRKQNRFHCMISGNCEKEKKIVIDKLITFLKREEKIIAVRRIPLQSFLTLNVRTTECYMKEESKSYFIDSGFISSKTRNYEPKDVPYKGDTTYLTHAEIEPRILYVLDGVSDFLEEYHYYSKIEKTDICKRMVKSVIDLLTDMSAENYIILDMKLNEVDTFLNLDARLKFVYQNYRITLPELSLDKMYEIYINTIKAELVEEIKDMEEHKKSFIDYISFNKKFMPFNNRELVNYLASYANHKNQVVFPENVYKTETLEESLSNIVGLQNVKDKLKELEKYMMFQLKAKAKGLQITASNMHMIFAGNSGTGKTMIANIISKMLFDLGIITENKLTKIDSKELLAESISQTALKTREAIEKAKGGILLINEAYTLNGQSTQGNFGTEVLGILMKAMENYKDEIILIFAGCRNEMRNFIDINSEIASKVGYIMDFKNYDSNELVEIFERKVQKTGMQLEEEAKESISKIMNYFSNIENFENGKFVDRVLEETLMNHAKNEENSIEVITEQDIPSVKQIIEDMFNHNYSTEDSTKVTREALRRTAVHEIGHAVIRFLLFKTPSIKNITINAEGAGALGAVLYTEIPSSYTSSKMELMNRIKTNLAGMGAEELYFGDFESGNGADLEKATSIARKMIMRLGMSDLGFGQISNRNGEMEEVISRETNKILKNCYDDVMMLLRKNKNKMDKVIDFLIEHSEINEEEFMNVFRDSNAFIF